MQKGVETTRPLVWCPGRAGAGPTRDPGAKRGRGDGTYESGLGEVRSTCPWGGSKGRLRSPHRQSEVWEWCRSVGGYRESVEVWVGQVTSV